MDVVDMVSSGENGHFGYGRLLWRKWTFLDMVSFGENERFGRYGRLL